MEEAKEKVFHIRLDPNDARRLEALTKLYGYRFASEFIRQSIRYIDKRKPALGEKAKPTKKQIQ